MKDTNSQAEEPPAQRQRRQRVDQAAVKRVMQFEVERGRQPKEMPYENEGYDIESYLPNGHLDLMEDGETLLKNGAPLQSRPH